MTSITETWFPACQCGQTGCLGHERQNGKVYVPGFTSQAAMDACSAEIVYFDYRLPEHVHRATETALVAA